MTFEEQQERGSWLPIVVTVLLSAVVLYMIRGLLTPLALATILAYLLNPIVDAGERWTLPRWLTILGVYILSGTLIAIGIAYLVPAALHQINEIQQSLRNLWPLLPGYLDAGFAWLNERAPAISSMIIDDMQSGTHIVATAQRYLTDLLSRAPVMLTSVLSNVANFLFYFVMVPFIAFFLLKDGREFKRGLVQLVPNRYFEPTLNVLGGVGEAVGRYLRGLLMQATILTTIASIGLMIIGLKFPVLVGVIAGVANMIPYVGPAIGVIASLIVFSTTGTGSLLGIAIVFSAAQFVDNFFVSPFVMSHSVKLHPLVVFLAVIFGGIYAGILGMFLAIPVTGAVVVSAQRLREALKPRVYSEH